MEQGQRSSKPRARERQAMLRLAYGMRAHLPSPRRMAAPRFDSASAIAHRLSRASAVRNSGHAANFFYPTDVIQPIVGNEI